MKQLGYVLLYCGLMTTACIQGALKFPEDMKFFENTAKAQKKRADFFKNLSTEIKDNPSQKNYALLITMNHLVNDLSRSTHRFLITRLKDSNAPLPFGSALSDLVGTKKGDKAFEDVRKKAMGYKNDPKISLPKKTDTFDIYNYYKTMYNAISKPIPTPPQKRTEIGTTPPPTATRPIAVRPGSPRSAHENLVPLADALKTLSGSRKG